MHEKLYFQSGSVRNLREVSLNLLKILSALCKEQSKRGCTTVRCTILRTIRANQTCSFSLDWHCRC